MTQDSDPAGKFDPSRAAEYERQARIALDGYEACHELAACLMAAALGRGGPARLLIGGAGGPGQEIAVMAPLEPGWRFTAVDPAPAMLDQARAHIGRAGHGPRVDWHAGTIASLPQTEPYDAATLIGVLHHLPKQAEKQQVLADIAARLKPGAPFILACNYAIYAERPLFLSAWGERWRMAGESGEAIAARLGRIRQGAVPPASEEAVLALLAEAGFEAPQRFFCSLFWGAWISFRQGAPAAS